MNLKVHLTNRGLNNRVEQTATGSEIQLTPDFQNSIGIGGYLWKVGFKLYLPLPTNWFTDEFNFDSRIFDIRGTLYTRKWLFDGTFQWYENQFPRSLPDSQLPTEADNRVTTVQSSFIVTHLLSGNRVSFRAPYSRNELQTRNSGSWMVGAGVSYARVGGTNSIFNAPVRSIFGRDSLVQNLEAVTYQVRPGYMHNFVLGDFFLHTAFALGIGLQQRSTERANTPNRNQWGVVPEYHLRGALGYDNGRYFGSIFMVWEQSSFEIEGLRVTNSSRNIQLFVGYRFATPAWLRKLEPKFLDKITD